MTSDSSVRYFSAFIALLWGVFSSIHELPQGSMNIWSLGFGTVSEDALFNYSNKEDTHHILMLVLLVNTPQILLSALYFMFNALFTGMLAAREWNGFTRHRKALRVTSPVGEQRSTYWLQLPWTYAIPLGSVSSALHWLVSQSIFLVCIKKFDPNHELIVGDTIVANGYSTYAMVVALAVGTVMIISLIINGLRKLEPGIPLVGSCSLAISAACHRPRDDCDASLLPLRWGCTSHQTTNGSGHCCFTSLNVEETIVGHRYV